MKIEDLKFEKKNVRAKVSAKVSWEDCDRPAYELYFETHEAFAESLTCNPHAFLIACIIPAMHYGEKRVIIDAEICPELLNGLITAMNWIRHWYYDPKRELVKIEAKRRSDLSAVRTSERAGFFFSGGIDAFATLRTNRLSFPLEHPWSIKDGLLVYGLEVDDREAFEHVLCSLSDAAQHIGITLIPVYTNLYLVYRQEDRANNFNFWTYEFQGAAFSAIAHAFARRFTVVSLASSSDMSHLFPQGSHPLLDSNYSSSELKIRHDGVTLSRLDKTKLIADWDNILQHLRVCNIVKDYRPGMLNCGKCPKCILTKLALLAIGVVDQNPAFLKKGISSEMIRNSYINSSYTESCYRELIAPLAEKGHHDLVQAIEYKIAKYHNSESGWKAKIRQLDRKYLNGNLRRFIAHMKAKSA
jgi:hypothetical protein